MMHLFKDTLRVVNVGLAGFGDNVAAAGGECVATAWQPPAQGDRDAAWALEDLDAALEDGLLDLLWLTRCPVLEVVRKAPGYASRERILRDRAAGLVRILRSK